MDQDIKTVIQYPVGATEFDIPFDYLSRKFVRVSLVAGDARRLLSNITEYRYVSKTRVKLLVSTTGFDRVEIRRFTSASERIIDFNDGSVLRATDLNVSQLQSAHIAEEARDSALMAMPQDDSGNLDARNRKIVRLAPGVVGTDAVNKNQLEDTIGEAGGILSNLKELDGEIREYIGKFADDTSLVRGVVWVYNSGVAEGGEGVIHIDKPTTVYSVPFIVVNGSRKEVGYHFTFDIETQSITLSNPLSAGDFLMAMTTESRIPLESLLSSPIGAASIGLAQGGTVQDAISNLKSDVYENVRNCANIESFGAKMIPNDATPAFELAYATGKPVYVPPGSWFTSKFIPDQTFGDGVVFSDETTYFSDSGQRPISPSAKSNQPIVERVGTWGNFERAGGRSLIVNNPTGRTQISGFSSPYQYASYANSDHVGYYIGMYGPQNQISTTAASTTYTVNTMTAPEIVEGADILVGMFISTRHSPRYKAKITGIDFDTHTITVDGWYEAGNATTGQIPANGYQAWINAADKVWAQNSVVFLNDKSTAVTATGYELGFSVSVTPGNPVWGFHAVNYDSYQLNQAFRATGNWGVAYYAGERVTQGVTHEVNSNYKPGSKTVQTNDIVDSGWTGATVSLNTNYRKAASRLAEVITGGAVHFSIDSRGVRSSQRESVAVVSSSLTLNGLSPSVILCTNTSAIDVTLSASNAPPGQVIEIRATNADVNVGGVVLSSTNGRYGRFIYDGSSYTLLSRGN